MFETSPVLLFLYASFLSSSFVIQVTTFASSYFCCILCFQTRTISAKASLLMLLSITSLSQSLANPSANPVAKPAEPDQYHIQTDEGKRRFFKYRTKSGSFRKETVLDDGTVVGSYGWVDANGILRIYDYIADDNGYRVTKDSSITLDEQDQNSDGQIKRKQP